jgi:membrane-associated protease RseP (regulator of RpoE activity)
MPASEALDHLDPHLEKLDAHAYLSHDDQQNQDLVTVLKGRFEPKPRPWWPNLILLILTLLSLFFIGAQIDASQNNMAFRVENLWRGWKYAGSLILILGSHELGHYFAARRHNVSVTLPYFIPMPFTIFGTLGAFIQLREPMRNRRVLFDVGVAGPLAGLIFAVPILFLGLATSDIHTIDPDAAGFREGNSILYAAAKYIIYGRLIPDGNEDVLINQFAQAGWTGLFVTALNLIPIGQLDGGHVMYTLFGKRAKQLYWPIIIIFIALSLYSQVWIIWTLLLLLLGRFYATPLDDITPLDRRRRLIGFITLIIFVLIFIPNPIEQI